MGKPFPSHTPYYHSHIIFNYPNKYNLDIALQLTTDTNLKGVNFKKFTENIIFDDNQKLFREQLISTHIRFYNLDYLKPQIPNQDGLFAIDNYININNIKINDEFKKHFK